MLLQRSRRELIDVINHADLFLKKIVKICTTAFYFCTQTRNTERKKGFVVPTKSFVKIGIPKIFCNNNKMFGSFNKTFGCCGKIFDCSNKNYLLSLIFCRDKTIFFRERTT